MHNLVTSNPHRCLKHGSEISGGGVLFITCIDTDLKIVFYSYHHSIICLLNYLHRFSPINGYTNVIKLLQTQKEQIYIKFLS